MNLISSSHFRLITWTSESLAILPVSNKMAMNCSSSSINISISNKRRSLGSFRTNPFVYLPSRVCITSAKKRNQKSEPVLDPTIVEEVSLNADDEDELLLEDAEDEELLDDDDDDFFEDEYLDEEAELFVGDGAGGGGISFAKTTWDKKALEIAEEVSSSFNGELGIYAFKTFKHASIQVRIERLTNKSGSPNMEDVEEFTLRYREKLDEAEAAGSIPSNISLEVSSPGVERVVQIPQDLDRFKDRPMFVKYTSEATEDGSLSEHDGVFRLVSFDLETSTCIWGIADVKVNREKAGKGRPLNKKQREWRLETPSTSLRLVRIYPL